MRQSRTGWRPLCDFHLAWCCDRRPLCVLLSFSPLCAFELFLRVLWSISQRKTFPGEKLPALSFGDGERDNSIVGFVPSPLQPLKYDLCHSPVNAGPRCHCFSPASWETEEFHNDCLFSAVFCAIACKIGRQACKKVDGEIPLTKSHSRLQGTKIRRVAERTGYYTFLALRPLIRRHPNEKRGELLSKYIVIMTVRLRRELIASCSQTFKRDPAKCWQASQIGRGAMICNFGGAHLPSQTFFILSYRGISRNWPSMIVSKQL